MQKIAIIIRYNELPGETLTYKIVNDHGRAWSLYERAKTIIKTNMAMEFYNENE